MDSYKYKLGPSLHLGVIGIMLHVTIMSAVMVEPPRSQVAFPGTILNYTCHGETYTDVRFNEVTTAGISPEADNYLNSLGISYVKPDASTVEFSINTSTKNSGTYFQCLDGKDNKTPFIFVYTVDDPPPPPAPPLVKAVNLTTLNVSWNSPWSFPVNSYSVCMRNNTSMQIIHEWNTTDTSKLVSKTWQSDCEGLEFVITANTDVGPSDPSQPTITGFPYGQYEGKTNATFVTQEVSNGSILLVVSINELEGCYYELLTYCVSVLDDDYKEIDYKGEVELTTLSNQTGHVTGDIALTFYFNGSSESYIQINLSVSNSLENIHFSSQTTQFIGATPKVETGYTTSSATSGSILPTPTTTNKNSLDILWILISVALAIAVVISCVCLIVSGAVMMIHKRKRKAQRRRVACQLEDIVLPKDMATNPIYEQPDGIYELIMDHSNIAPLGKATNDLACNGKGNYSNGKACNDELGSIPLFPKKSVGDNTESDDEYVQMSALNSKHGSMPCSTSPRYTEAPGTVLKDDINADLPSLHKGLL